MHIRRRTPEDEPACARVAEAVRAADGYPKYFDGDFHAFVASADALAAWVADVDGEIAGHVALHSRTLPAVMALAARELGLAEDRLAVVARLFVAPERRGRGLGAGLMGAAAGEARRQGRWPVLDVLTEYRGAVALYDALGWRRLGVARTVLENGSEFVEFVYAHPRGPQPARRGSGEVI